MNLRLIRSDELDQISDLCANAFIDDPLFDYFFPRLHDRKKKEHFFFNAQLKMCASFTFVLDEMDGVIIYQRPSDTLKSLSILDGVHLFVIVGMISIFKAVSYQRFNHKVIKEINSKEMDQLVLICVDEKSRNNGVARIMIHQLYASKVYLETQNQDNLDFYHKLGFKVKHLSTFNDHRKSINHFVLVKEDLV